MRWKNHADCFINYRNRDISTMCASKISSGNISFCWGSCIDGVSINWWVRNLTRVSNMIKRFRWINEWKSYIRFIFFINWWLNEVLLFIEQILINLHNHLNKYIVAVVWVTEEKCLNKFIWEFGCRFTIDCTYSVGYRN
jgi:hypothetical protein